MKYKSSIIITICLLTILFSCKKETIVLDGPSDISSPQAEARPGSILLSWKMPNDSSVHYVEVSYYDHRLKKDIIKLSSTDSIEILNTRKKFGEYSFDLLPYSTNRLKGKNINIKSISDAAPIVETILREEKLELTKEQLSTNALRESDGPEKLLDGDNSTFFHTQWQSPPPGPHYLEIDLKKDVQHFRFNYSPRTTHTETKPTDVDLFGSMDGNEWFLIRNLTVEEDQLPTTKTDSFNSPTYSSDQVFRYFRFSVNKTNKEHVFWTMSEFEFFTIEKHIIDPEDPDTNY